MASLIQYFLNRVYFDCKTKCALQFLAGKENVFAQESFYLQGILSDINERDTCV